MLLAGGLATGAALLAFGALRLFDDPSTAPSRVVPTGLARIVRTDVIERQQEAGTLGFRGSFTVFNGASAGVITRLPNPGSVVSRNESLYELDLRPVILFYGGRPAYRDFALGMSNGGDVWELKRNLLALGFSNGGRIVLDKHFDLATRGAVKDWQRSLCLPPTGRISLGSVVFLPAPVRISGAETGIATGATVPAGGAVLSATTNRPSVLVPLDPGSVSQLKLGDRVLVTMPDGSVIPGRISAIARIATAPTNDSGQGPSTPTIPVTVSLLRSASRAALDQAPVQVAITTQQAKDVLAVPISALLARPGGGYAVQVEDPRGTRLVPVSTGLFDDVAGRVEISGPGLAAGERVVVPAG